MQQCDWMMKMRLMSEDKAAFSLWYITARCVCELATLWLVGGECYSIKQLHRVWIIPPLHTVGGRGRDELRGEGWQHRTKQTSKPTGLTVWTSNICHCVVTIRNQKVSICVLIKTITVDNIQNNCLCVCFSFS